MANNFTSETNLQAQWKFESGALTTDSSGKANTLTNNGSCGSSTSDYKNTDGGSCSLDLNRTTPQYMSKTDASLSADFPWASDGTSMTGSVCVWFKADAINADDTIFSKWTTTSNLRQIRLVFGTGNTFRLQYSSAGTSATSVDLYNSGTVQTNRWYHVGFTWNNATYAWQLRIWDDTAGSVIINASGTAAAAMAAKNGIVRIGYLLDGHIDECLVFNRVLSTTEIDSIRQGLFPVAAVTVTPDNQDLTWSQSSPLSIIQPLPDKQDLAWSENAPEPVINFIPDAQSLSWQLKDAFWPGAAFVDTADDKWTKTTDDEWNQLNCTVPVGKQDLTWTVNEVQYAENLYVDVEKQILTWTVNVTVPKGLISPDKQDLTWSLQVCNPVVVPWGDGQILTWTIEGPTVSTGSSKTIYPDKVTLVWSLKSGIAIGTGDMWGGTADDQFVDFQDKWGFSTTPSSTLTVLVDKQLLTWSQPSPTVNFGNTVYAFPYLKNEAGFPIRDEAGNPIRTEDSMNGLTLVWSQGAPTISKAPEIQVIPTGLNLTWTVNSAVTVGVVALSSKQDLTYTLNTPLRPQMPSALAMAWAMQTPDILGDRIYEPDAIDLIWSMESPRITGTGRGRRRRRGLLLGVYEG